MEIMRQGCWVYRVSQQTGEAMARVSWRMVFWSVPRVSDEGFQGLCQSTALGGGNYWGGALLEDVQNLPHRSLGLESLALAGTNTQ